MYILYLDESGSATNVDEEYFVLAGIATFERQVHFLGKQLDEIALDYSSIAPQDLEFHASKIYNGNEAPWSGMPRHDRNILYNKILKVIAGSHESTKLFACVIHKPSFPGQDPVLKAFEQLCSRFDLMLQRLYYEGNNHRGMIVFDKTSYEEGLQGLTSEFHRHGTQWGKLKNIVEVPLFVDSKASRLIQLADHIAHAVFRRYQAKDTRFFDPICPRFDRNQGKIHGLVHIHRIETECMCPACMSRV